MNYESIAYYYDLIHQNLTEDIPFLLNLAQEANGSTLELGCGTGRVLAHLSHAGIPVTGLDNSPAMLKIAKQHLPNVSLIEADMTTFSLPNKYNLIIISYNTFLHLPPQQKQQTLQQACRHLTPQGKLFIDLPNPLDLATIPNDQVLLLEKTLTDPQTGNLLLLFARNHLAATEQRLHTTWLYDISPSEGGIVHRLVDEMDYYFLYPHEIEELLLHAGMSLHSLLGTYTGTPYDEDSPRLLATATPVNIGF